jgi:hypothetical protein
VIVGGALLPAIGHGDRGRLVQGFQQTTAQHSTPRRRGRESINQPTFRAIGNSKAGDSEAVHNFSPTTNLDDDDSLAQKANFFIYFAKLYNRFEILSDLTGQPPWPTKRRQAATTQPPWAAAVGCFLGKFCKQPQTEKLQI